MRAAAGGRRCPGARARVDVCRGQHGRAADPRARKRQLLEGDKPWHEERLPLVEDRVRDRLGQLSRRLGDADWLDGAFNAGDLMMVSVLLRLKSSGLLDEFPNLAAYLARGEARPAYRRTFHAQLAVNTGKPPTA
jgi:glutathione S-transferase